MGLLPGKKNKVGIQPTPRKKSEINQEYQLIAFRVGHKQRVIFDNSIESEKLDKEITEHLQELRRLNYEYNQAKAEDPETVSPAPEVAAK